jgi:hypothetical protein
MRTSSTIVMDCRLSHLIGELAGMLDRRIYGFPVLAPFRAGLIPPRVEPGPIDSNSDELTFYVQAWKRESEISLARPET